MSAAELIAGLLRGGHVAALVSLFGTLVFLALTGRRAMGRAPAAAPGLRRRLRLLASGSAVAALLTGLAWLTAETVLIAGTDGVAATLHALPVVGWQTGFGRWLVLRGVILLATLPLLRGWQPGLLLAVATSGVALALQPLLGHAGAMGGSAGAALIVSEAMHLLAAGAWLGALLPLLLTVRCLPHQAASIACRSFTPVGLGAVAVLMGTAVVQAADLVGGVPGLFGSPYGHVALVKIGLFLALLALAALNRLALTDRLGDPSLADPGRAMRRSLRTEAVLGLLVILAAGLLATELPGTHQQPVWPFGWRLSLEALADPDLRMELLLALGGLGLAVASLVAGLVVRRLRGIGLVLALVIATPAIPHLDLLFVPAYPTSFFRSPTDFAASAIVHGARLYAANCAACHGETGRGDGPAAAGMAIRPADLLAGHLWAHSDGDMFWFVSHGVEGPDGALVMPGFGGTLSDAARWDLIDFVRARNAGAALQATGAWPQPVPVPQLDATCPDGRTIDLDDLRGRVVRLVALPDGGAVPPDAAGVRTIVLARGRTPVAGACVAAEPQAWPAFAILAGVPADALGGTQFLADGAGWLRTVWRPGEPGDWTSPQGLAAAAAAIVAHPLAVEASGGVHHH